MPSFFFSFGIIKRIFFFFTIWIHFWDISWTHIFFFNIKNIKSNCQIKTFYNNLFLMDNFLSNCIYKWFNIWNFSGCGLISSEVNATVAAYWKHLSSAFFVFIDAFFFLIQSGEIIYEPQCIKLTLWHR